MHSDWLKQRALSEIREWVDDFKLAFKFLLLSFDKFDPVRRSSTSEYITKEEIILKK